MFGTLQKRLPQELRLAGITDMAGANRFLKELFLPQHNARFATPAEDQGTARPLHRLAQRHPAIHEERRSNDNIYKRLALQRRPPPPIVKARARPRIPRRHNGRLPWTAMSGAIPRRWPTYRQPNPRGRVTRFDATDRRPVDKWTAAPHPTTSPQGQQPQQKRSTHMVHKPVNSECSRHPTATARRQNAPLNDSKNSMAGYDFSRTPRPVPPLETAHRRIRTAIPAPGTAEPAGEARFV